jgi:hypothetical protein
MDFAEVKFGIKSIVISISDGWEGPVYDENKTLRPLKVGPKIVLVSL